MLRFLGRRLVTSAIPLVIVVVGVFALSRLTGDPALLYLPESASEEQREAYREAQGFNDPILVQLWNYVQGVVQLDFGTSLRTGRDGLTMALEAYPATLGLAFWALLLSGLIAVTLGSWAAFRPNSIADRISSFLSMTAASIPDFWFAITGILLFAVTLGWLPTSGNPNAWAWILPVATLMLRPVGVLTQVVRGSMINSLAAPYVKVAKSKGATRKRLATHHTLRNAATPSLSVGGDLAVNMINGAVVVETVFGWPGIGKLLIDSVLQRDFPTLQAAVILTAIAIFALNIVIDILYAMLDPRVREVPKKVTKK